MYVGHLTALGSHRSRFQTLFGEKSLLFVPVLAGVTATLISILYVRDGAFQETLGFPFPWLVVSHFPITCPLCTVCIVGRCPYGVHATIDWAFLLLDILSYTAIGFGLLLFSRRAFAHSNLTKSSDSSATKVKPAERNSPVPESQASCPTPGQLGLSWPEEASDGQSPTSNAAVASRPSYRSAKSDLPGRFSRRCSTHLDAERPLVALRTSANAHVVVGAWAPR